MPTITDRPTTVANQGSKLAGAKRHDFRGAATAYKARIAAMILWSIAILCIPIWIALDHPGWDVAVYRNAIVSVKAGHDPYADAMVVQDAFHHETGHRKEADHPFSYVYSPMTLPLLRVIGSLPVWLSITGFSMMYVTCSFSLIWFGRLATDCEERRYWAFLAPIAIFFPGMLQHDTVLSGNIAFILYALVLWGAVVGWRQQRWWCCYLAILLASCFKLPMLSLLAVPVLSARRQWLPAGATAAVGAAMFGVQSLLWPSLFHNFLRAVELQFSYNRDFGCAPAGLFSDFLFTHGVPYSVGGVVFYLSYAVPMFGLLAYLSTRFLGGRLSLQQWLPVMLIGVILLNPRIMQYDVFALTVPLLLIGLRFVRQFTRPVYALSVVGLTLFVANVVAMQSLVYWKEVECCLLLCFFVAGAWDLLRCSRETTDYAVAVACAS